MPNFAEKVEKAVESLSGGSTQVDEGDFIGASQLVIDHVRHIRKAILTNRVSVTTAQLHRSLEVQLHSSSPSKLHSPLALSIVFLSSFYF